MNYFHKFLTGASEVYVRMTYLWQSAALFAKVMQSFVNGCNQTLMETHYPDLSLLGQSKMTVFLNAMFGVIYSFYAN